MTQYTEYQIVEALLAQDLIETVKQNMAEGWTCQGGQPRPPTGRGSA